MPSNDRIIVGIDIGTHKVTTIVAEAESGPGNRLNVLGVGAVASEGITKGMVTDIVAASQAIEHSLEAAERQSGCRILSAYVSMSGNHIASMNSRGLVAVSGADRIISQDDATRAIESASALAVPTGRDILHVIPRTYTVDGQEGIRNPVGMSGFRLDVETHIVTSASNVKENVVRCVRKAMVEVDDVVLAPLASAEAVLTEQEKNLGVVLVDVGHGTTDIAIYIEGSVWHTKIVPVGGWQMTNDLVVVLNIPYEGAEALKLQYGRAIAPGTSAYWKAREQQATLAAPVVTYTNGHSVGALNGHGSAPAAGRANGVATEPSPNHRELAPSSDEEMLEVRTFEDTTRLVSRDEINEVMAARLDQLLGLVADEVRRSGYEGLLPAGVVLTGGVAAMPGIEGLAQGKLRMPVRVGHPKHVGGLADAFENPAYATTVGLTLWGLKHEAVNVGAGLRKGPAQQKARAGFGFFVDWLKNFDPNK